MIISAFNISSIGAFGGAASVQSFVKRVLSERNLSTGLWINCEFLTSKYPVGFHKTWRISNFYCEERHGLTKGFASSIL